EDPRLGVAAEVVGHEEPDGPGLAIDDGAGVAAGVVAVVPDDLRLAPRPAAVGAAAQEQVDVATVAAALLAPFAEGEQGAFRRDDERRDAVGVVAPLAGREQRLLLDRRGAGHELLDALAIDLSDVDGPPRIDTEHVRQPELPRAVALLAKAAQ